MEIKKSEMITTAMQDKLTRDELYELFDRVVRGKGAAVLTFGIGGWLDEHGTILRLVAGYGDSDDELGDSGFSFLKDDYEYLEPHELSDAC